MVHGSDIVWLMLFEDLCLFFGHMFSASLMSRFTFDSQFYTAWPGQRLFRRVRGDEAKYINGCALLLHGPILLSIAYVICQ